MKHTCNLFFPRYVKIKCECGKMIKLNRYDSFDYKTAKDLVFIGTCNRCLTIWSKIGDYSEKGIGKWKDKNQRKLFQHS